MSKDNRATPVEGHGVTRVELNMHVSPGRETDTLYQLAENSKVEMLKRATTERATPEEIAAVKSRRARQGRGRAGQSRAEEEILQARAARPPHRAEASRARRTVRANPGSAIGSSSPHSAEEPKPKPMDDWWLVRDPQGHVGWVLARMVDLDIPLDVAQYAEGQRIQAAFVLNTVQDEVKGAIPQYLVLLNENKDGIPYDFNQVRVFTWNLKRHRYETGYREHFIIGYFPATVSTERLRQGRHHAGLHHSQAERRRLDQRAQVPASSATSCARCSLPAKQPPAGRPLARRAPKKNAVPGQEICARQKQRTPEAQILISGAAGVAAKSELLRRAIHPRRANANPTP